MTPLEIINKVLEEKTIKRFRDFKLAFKFKYPKLLILIASIILAYSIFTIPKVTSVVSGLQALSYLGIFIAGLMFSFGFTAPIAVGFLIISNPSNIILASAIGGTGALVSDLFIFRVIKMSFADEFEKLKKEPSIQKLSIAIKNKLGLKISNYLMYTFAGILIASPLPDEAGVTMLAGLTRIKENALAILSFVLNSLGIYIILILSA